MQDYLYSVIGFIAIAVQLIINYRVMFVTESYNGRKAGRMYRRLMLAIFAYYITDALWGILAGLNWIPLLFADTTVYYVAMSLIIVFFYRYFVEYLEMQDWKGRLFAWFGRIFFILEIIFLVVNFFLPIFFWFDESDAYVAGPVRYIALWVQVAMFGFSSLVTLLNALKTEGGGQKTPPCHLLLQPDHVHRHPVPGKVPAAAVLRPGLPSRKQRAARVCRGG